MAKKSNKEVNTRYRHWTCIVYPESAVKDWKKKLQEKYINFAVSPLHDKDIDPTGEPKKPHYHVYMKFDGVKSYNQIKEITDELNATIPQKVENEKGLIRYFIHIDNPDKYQYNFEDIEKYGNIDISSCFQTDEDNEKTLKEIINFIEKNNIIELCDLINYAMNNNKMWFKYLQYSCYLVGQYIKSKRNKFYFERKYYAKYVDRETGEILCNDEK